VAPEEPPRADPEGDLPALGLLEEVFYWGLIGSLRGMAGKTVIAGHVEFLLGPFWPSAQIMGVRYLGRFVPFLLGLMAIQTAIL